jgi:hypothetical protein
MNLGIGTARMFEKRMLREISSLGGKQEDYVEENWLSGSL